MSVPSWLRFYVLDVVLTIRDAIAAANTSWKPLKLGPGQDECVSQTAALDCNFLIFRCTKRVSQEGARSASEERKRKRDCDGLCSEGTAGCGVIVCFYVIACILFVFA